MEKFLGTASLALEEEQHIIVSSRDRSFASESMVWKRNRLIAALLTEPEVLQLVEQFRSVFRDLYLLYTEAPNVETSDSIFGDEAGSDADSDSTKRKPSRREASKESVASRNMEFADFVQFCQDFKIVPRLATMHGLWRAYNCAVCLDYSECGERTYSFAERRENPWNMNPDGEYRDPALLDIIKEYAQNIVQGFRGDFSAAFDSMDLNGDGYLTVMEMKLGCARGLGGFAGDIKVVFKELDSQRLNKVYKAQFKRLAQYLLIPAPPADAVSTSRPTLTHASTQPLGQADNRLSLPGVGADTLPGVVTRRSSRIPSMSSPAPLGSLDLTSAPKRGSMGSGNSQTSRRKSATGGTDKKTRRSSGLTPDAAASPSPTPEPSAILEGPPIPLFGVSAFVETICRVVLTYFIVHGNAVQQASPSSAKIVWLLTYFQAALEHLRQAVDRRLESPREKGDDSCEANTPDPVPPGVSRRLAIVIRRLDPERFKVLQPMVLQLDGYNPSVVIPEAMKVSVPDSPLKAKVLTPKEKERRNRRKISHGKDNGAASPTATPRYSSHTSNRAASNASTGELSDVNEEHRQSSRRNAIKEGDDAGPEGRALRDVCRPLMLRGVATRGGAWGVATRLASWSKGSSSGAVSRASRPESAQSVRSVASVQTQQSVQESEADNMSTKASVKGCKSTKASTASEASMQDKQEKEEAKDDQPMDVVQDAIENRPKAPKPRDDSFKFKDLLFERLLRPVDTASGSSAASGVAGESRGVTKTPGLDGESRGPSHLETDAGPSEAALLRPLSVMSQRASECLDGRLSAMSSMNYATFKSRSLFQTLDEDRGDLVRAVGSCIGKVDRCSLTPPPMNAYAVQLNERIEHMMGWDREKSPEERRGSPNHPRCLGVGG